MNDKAMMKKITFLNHNWLKRAQPKQPVVEILKAGLGGLGAIAVLALFSQWDDNAWLMAPFGASCVLLFCAPKSPLSQPINVIGGHFVSALVGLILYAWLPESWWAMGMAVGLAIVAMGILRLTHPPAGADPLVIFVAAPGWDYLLFPVLSGSLILVLLALIWHRLPPKAGYPLLVDGRNTNHK